MIVSEKIRRLRRLYLITVKYGKEKLAEFEVGDSIFPHDTSVSIRETGIPGVLVVETLLSFKELLKALLEYPPTTLARIVPLTACVSYRPAPEAMARLIYEAIRDHAQQIGRVRLGRHGRLSSRTWSEVLEILKGMLDRAARGSSASSKGLTLLIEPLKDVVCLGITRDEEDKAFIKTVRRLQPYRRLP